MTGKIVGYARVSTVDQSLDIQIAALKAAGAEKIFSEKASGTSADRPELKAALEYVRDGDQFIVTRIDRFARSVGNLHMMLNFLAAKDVAFRAIEQGGADVNSNTGKLLLAILGAVAEFETDLSAERQREGIAAAKAKGVYRGRKPSIDRTKIILMLGEGMKPSEIAAELGASRASIYRLAKMEAGNNVEA